MQAGLVKNKATHLIRDTAVKEMSRGVSMDATKTAGRWDFSTLSVAYIFKNWWIVLGWMEWEGCSFCNSWWLAATAGLSSRSAQLSQNHPTSRHA